MEQVIETFIWDGVAIEVRYIADYSPNYRDFYGYALAHQERRTAPYQ
jgi:hypothetical protein